MPRNTCRSEMFAKWKKLDPMERYEKYLTENKMWDAKGEKEIDARIDRELTEELEIAENSPFPPPELAEQGVYCDGCHTIEAVWKRPKKEVMPPKSSVNAEWNVERFGGIEQGEARGDERAAESGESGNGRGTSAWKRSRTSRPAQNHSESRTAKDGSKSKPAENRARKKRS